MFCQMRNIPLVAFVLTFSSTVHAQFNFFIGDTVEVTNIGKGIIVGGYQKSEFNYGTYKVHLAGEKYCNHHVTDSRYNDLYIKPATNKKPEQKITRDEEPQTKQAGEYAVGDTVLYSQTVIWQKGVIKSYDAAKRRYAIKDVYGDIPCYAVAYQAKVFNNEFFIGTWDFRISSALYSTVEGKKKYTNVSVGAKLYPLTIKKDGTYTWKVTNKKTITGQWKPRSGAPGIVVLKGIDGKDWILYETTEAFATTKSTKDAIRFHHLESSTGYGVATRIGPNKSCVLSGRSFKN